MHNHQNRPWPDVIVLAVSNARTQSAWFVAGVASMVPFWTRQSYQLVPTLRMPEELYYDVPAEISVVKRPASF